MSVDPLTRFVRLETQVSATGGLEYRATVLGYATDGLEPGEVWCSSSGWSCEQNFPLGWLKGAYPELWEKWEAVA